ncbi:hypothetical protein Aduo_016939 [Ancylostoma duodenale]
MLLRSNPYGLSSCRGLIYSLQHCRLVSTSNSAKDYYQVLGVQRDATQRQIKVAYYQLSKKYHPDVAGHNAGSEAKFIEITEAYECLKDPERRRMYDNGMSGGGGRYTGDPYDFRDYRQYAGRRSDNPFYSRRYTQQEYQRIWEQFNRMRAERESYDERMRREGEKIWEEFARQRAERWQRFHAKYPNGPPGSIRYEYKWTSNPIASRNITIFTRVLVIYMAIFALVTFVQVIAEPFYSTRDYLAGEIKPRKVEEVLKQEKPRVQFDYMSQQPGQSEGWNNVIINSYPTGEVLESEYTPSVPSQSSSF